MEHFVGNGTKFNIPAEIEQNLDTLWFLTWHVHLCLGIFSCKAKLLQVATLYSFYHQIYLPAKIRQSIFGHGEYSNMNKIRKT